MSAGSVRLKQKMADLISDLTQHSEEKKEKNEKLEQYVMEIEVKAHTSRLRTYLHYTIADQ